MNKAMSAALIISALGLAAGAWAQPQPKGPDDQQEPGMEDPRQGPMGRRHGPMGPGMQERDPAVEKEAMEYLKKQVPEFDEELKEMKREGPNPSSRKFREYMFAYRDERMREQFVKGLRTEMKVRRLVKAVRQGQGADKEKLKSELEAALSEQFDHNLARMEFRLKKMQEEIGGLKSRIDKRRALKSEIVKKRLGEVTGDVEPWEW